MTANRRKDPLASLTIDGDHFLFADVSRSDIREKLRSDPYWDDIGNDAFATKNLGAAKLYRQYGSPSVEKFFRRTFQEKYILVDWPWISTEQGFDPHQIDGVNWVLSRKRSYLAHAPGSGKTCEAISAAILSEGPGPVLFIVPPQLTVNWEREIHKFAAWFNVWPAIGIIPTSEGKDSAPWRADFIICPDSMLTKDWVYEQLRARKWKFIAVDEASRFKEQTAERSVAFYGGSTGKVHWPGIFRDARHVVFLDGSPMPNRPIELWAPTYALHPEAIDCLDYDDFGYRYCGGGPNERGVWEYKYSRNEAELKEKLQKDFMHVVTEDQISSPERLRSMLFMDSDVRSMEQKTWERRHLSDIRFADLDEKSSKGDLARFRKELGLRKVPWVVRYVKQRLEQNESILLFAWHREVCEALGEALDCPVIYGGTNPQHREEFFQKFQKGDKRPLVMNIAAGGRGHNLQRADRAVFAEFSWSDEMNRQCEHRGARRGNRAEFFRSDYIVCPRSMDEPVLQSVFTKQRRVKAVIG
jgi:SNF2 family DNA or RNA helicase